MDIAEVLQHHNSVGVNGLSDDELILLTLWTSGDPIINKVTVPIAQVREAARFDLSRRQNARMVCAAEMQVKSARGLFWATICLVFSTFLLVIVTIAA